MNHDYALEYAFKLGRRHVSIALGVFGDFFKLVCATAYEPCESTAIIGDRLDRRQGSLDPFEFAWVLDHG